MTKKKKVIITVLAVLLLLVGARYAHKSYQKHQVFSKIDFLSAEEKVYGLSVIWETAKTYYGMWDQVPSWIGTQNIRPPLGACWKPTAYTRIITS